jgi:hypothetical protein
MASYEAQATMAATAMAKWAIVTLYFTTVTWASCTESCAQFSCVRVLTRVADEGVCIACSDGSSGAGGGAQLPGIEKLAPAALVRLAIHLHQRRCVARTPSRGLLEAAEMTAAAPPRGPGRGRVPHGDRGGATTRTLRTGSDALPGRARRNAHEARGQVRRSPAATARALGLS